MVGRLALVEVGWGLGRGFENREREKESTESRGRRVGALTYVRARRRAFEIHVPALDVRSSGF